MYIRRKVFSILDTESEDRLDQREFTGETKRRNKALKRQWLEKLGEEEGKRIAKDNSIIADIDKSIKRSRDSYNTKFGQKGAGNVVLGRIGYERSQKPDELDVREFQKKHLPEDFKANREKQKKLKKARRDAEKFLEHLKKMDEFNPKPNPEVVVPEKALVVSNPKPVIKTESKLSKLAKNKHARTAAGLLALGGTAAGGYYLLNKKKNKKDKEDKD